MKKTSVLKSKKLILSLAVSAATTVGLFAQVAPGTHTGVITDISLDKPSPAADASWIFNDAVLSNFDMNVNAGAGYEFTVELNSSTAVVSNLYMQSTGTNTIILKGADASNRTVVTFATPGGWPHNITANGQNALRLEGYSNVTYSNFKIASDSGNVSAGGSAGVSISGASNNFTAIESSYINANANTAAGKLYFDISGETGAKSTATFNSLSVRASGDVDTSINMKGNAIFTTNGAFNFATDTSGGLAKFTMSNSGNEFIAKAAVNIGSVATGGGADFDIGGSSNTFTSTANFNVGGAGDTTASSQSTGGTFNVTMSGSQNQFVNNAYFNFGRHSNGAISTFTLGGTDNSFSSKNEFNLGRNQTAGATSFIMAGTGNTFIHSTGGNSFFIGANMTGGDVDFTIGGKNNIVEIAGNMYVGSDISGAVGSATFAVQGSGHDIDISGNLVVRDRDSNKGILSFVADSEGLSTVNATNVNGLSNLEISLTDFIGDASNTYTVMLISANNNWSGEAAKFIGSGTDSSGIVTMGANGLSWEISYDDGNLFLTYTYIPEPTTYAAIFGALALAFVAYRRRK